MSLYSDVLCLPNLQQFVKKIFSFRKWKSQCHFNKGCSNDIVSKHGAIWYNYSLLSHFKLLLSHFVLLSTDIKFNPIRLGHLCNKIACHWIFVYASKAMTCKKFFVRQFINILLQYLLCKTTANISHKPNFAGYWIKYFAVVFFDLKWPKQNLCVECSSRRLFSRISTENVFE